MSLSVDAPCKGHPGSPVANRNKPGSGRTDELIITTERKDNG
jgi:hypothetical protein